MGRPADPRLIRSRAALRTPSARPEHTSADKRAGAIGIGRGTLSDHDQDGPDRHGRPVDGHQTRRVTASPHGRAVCTTTRVSAKAWRWTSPGFYAGRASESYGTSPIVESASG